MCSFSGRTHRPSIGPPPSPPRLTATSGRAFGRHETLLPANGSDDRHRRARRTTRVGDCWDTQKSIRVYSENTRESFSSPLVAVRVFPGERRFRRRQVEAEKVLPFPERFSIRPAGPNSSLLSEEASVPLTAPALLGFARPSFVPR